MVLWEVLADSAREHWALDPFTAVGPLRFGMSPDEASAALGGTRWSVSRADPYFKTTLYDYPQAGLRLYHDSGERLHAIKVNALRGPQVLAEGRALVAQVPSELEAWMAARAEAREPFTELAYMPAADPASLTLGVVACVQRAGDRLVTRPVFLPASAMDDIYHQLPAEAWAIT
jgi:hypothetical protein